MVSTFPPSFTIVGEKVQLVPVSDYSDEIAPLAQCYIMLTDFLTNKAPSVYLSYVQSSDAYQTEKDIPYIIGRTAKHSQ